MFYLFFLSERGDIMQGNHPENVMEETGKQNKVFVSSDDIFQNTECLFIEYDDVLKSPMFSVLVPSLVVTDFKSICM